MKILIVVRVVHGVLGDDERRDISDVRLNIAGSGAAGVVEGLACRRLPSLQCFILCVQCSHESE